MHPPENTGAIGLPVSRQLHDIVVPQLFVLATGLAALKRHPDASRASQLVEDLADTADQTLADLRSISRGTAINEGGQLTRVGHRLRSATGSVARLTSCQVDVDVVGSAEISSAAEDDVSAVAWEAVANAIRHGNATVVKIRILASEARLTVTVTDNGKWRAPESSDESDGTGIHSLRARAENWGGHASITNCEGATTVQWQVPLVTSRTSFAPQ